MVSILAPSTILFDYSLHYGFSKISTSSTSPDIDLSDLPEIDYDSLNKSWYDQGLEMLIIVPNGSESFRDAVEPLARYKNQKGVKTLILSNFSLYGNESDDNATKIRKMIRSYYNSDGIRWVLLAGDAQDDLIPIRYVHNSDTELVDDSEPLGSETSKPTDYYYADLNGTWDTDGDGIYGESSAFNANGTDEIDWIPEVYVGRLPASTGSELAQMVNKTLKYEQNPKIGDWMNDMLLAGGVSEIEGGGEDEAELTTYIWQNYVQDRMSFTHLCANTSHYSPPGNYTFLDQTSFRNEVNNGHSTIIFAGHGNPTTFSDKYNKPAGGGSREIYTKTNAQSVTNNDMPSLIYADACATSPYDSTDDNMGEVLIKKVDGGAIGYIGAMRITYYFPDDSDLEALNRGNAKLFWKVFFEDHTYQQGKTLYDSKVAYLNSDYYLYEKNPYYNQAHRKQLLTYCLLGDPETDIYTDIAGVVSEDPFPAEVYEGQMLNLTIKDNYSRTVQNPRVYIFNDDEGIGRTVYGDRNGNVKIRLPLGANITYNVSISGHNLLGTSNFSFITLPDTESPNITNVGVSITNGFLSTEVNFIINTSDDASGIESLFVIFSTDNFNSFFYHQIRNEFNENQHYFDFTIDTLQVGTYQYLIYTRDYTNKTEMKYQSSYRITISVPIGVYVIIGGTIGGISVFSIAVVLYVRWDKKRAENLLDPIPQ